VVGKLRPAKETIPAREVLNISVISYFINIYFPIPNEVTRIENKIITERYLIDDVAMEFPE